MKLLTAFLIWCCLVVLCWPLAFLALILFPLLWLVSVPFRIVFFLVEGILLLLKGLILFPARLITRRSSP